MTLNWRYSNLRYGLICAWWFYMAAVAYYWLGMAGVATWCLLCTRAWQSALLNPLNSVHLNWSELHSAWVLPWVVHVRVGQHALWLFEDELSAGQWAQLNRSIRIYMPRQAVGLSISK